MPKFSIFRRRFLYCCINFGNLKSLEKRGGGGGRGEGEGRGVSRFSVENFLSHSGENLRREFFTVALFSGIEKVWIRGVGSIKIFHRKCFVSQSRKSS